MNHQMNQITMLITQMLHSQLECISTNSGIPLETLEKYADPMYEQEQENTEDYVVPELSKKQRAIAATAMTFPINTAIPEGGARAPAKPKEVALDENGQPVAPAKKARCLLYTSPSPRD